MGIMERLARRAGRPTTTTHLAAPRPEDPPPVKVGADLGTLGSSAQSGGRDTAKVGVLNATKLTPRLVEAMREHHQVSACLAVQSLPLVRAEWVVECEDDEAREWLTAQLEPIMRELMRTAARALWAGYSPNVLVWDVDEATGGLTVTQVRDLDPYTCRPLQDKAGRYLGFLQHPETDRQVDVPALQSLWLVEGLESGNLYGRSILTAARIPWQEQQTLDGFHLRHLERFGEPVVRSRAPSGFTVTNQAEIDAAYAAGTTPPDPIRVDNVDAAVTLGESLKNHSVLGLPSERAITADGKDVGYAWEVDYLESSRDGGTSFLDAIRERDKRIARGMLVPDLLLDNTDAGSYALGKEHRSVFTDGVSSRLAEYAGQITRHLVDRLNRWNFGERAPEARLTFAPQADEDRDQLWELALGLMNGDRLPLDVIAIAERLGLPVAEDAEEQVDDEEEGSPPEAAPPAGEAMTGHRPTIHLAGAPADTTGMPAWKAPQAVNTTSTWRRELTPREARVGFARVESDLNRMEAQTIAHLEELLEGSRDKVLRQVQGIMRKGGSVAEIAAALGGVNVGGVGPWADAWTDLQRSVWGVGLESVRRELAQAADLIPENIGRDGMALVRQYAQASAERHLTTLATTVRLEAMAALTSGVSSTGMMAAVADLYDREIRGENRPARLTTRMLTAKALNESRRDAVERGGVQIRGAQYSAILDRVTCDLCERLDEQEVPVTHPDFRRFTAPLHHNCRCVWVFIGADEVDWTPSWGGAPESMVGQYGGLVF